MRETKPERGRGRLDEEPLEKTELMDRFVWLPRLKIDGALCREWCEEWWWSRERRRRLLAKGKSQLILIFFKGGLQIVLFSGVVGEVV